jgi:hypothetical protein
MESSAISAAMSKLAIRRVARWLLMKEKRAMGTRARKTAEKQNRTISLRRQRSTSVHSCSPRRKATTRPANPAKPAAIPAIERRKGWPFNSRRQNLILARPGPGRLSWTQGETDTCLLDEDRKAADLLVEIQAVVDGQPDALEVTAGNLPDLTVDLEHGVNSGTSRARREMNPHAC